MAAIKDQHFLLFENSQATGPVDESQSTDEKVTYLDDVRPQILKAMELNKLLNRSTFYEQLELQEKITSNCSSKVDMNFCALIDKKAS